MSNDDKMREWEAHTPESLKNFKPVGWHMGGTVHFHEDGSVERFGGIGGIFYEVVKDKEGQDDLTIET